MFPKPGQAAATAAPERDPQRIAIDALGFVAGRDELVRRFLDVTGLEVGHLRAAAAEPTFFVGLLDFLLANEADLMDFAGAAGLDPAEIGRAREALAS
ncbi:DUF3572 family protein [Aureimonas leprariae]|uniref:DUF3572 family protein n=2 Tax=Plantimonas leprariae TaxID=2615207 RepID=A0A7V7PKF0_9HYPH|nr:DUF3572 family protein [Aureimonas leprariae]